MIDRDAITYLTDIPAAQARVRGDRPAVVTAAGTLDYATLDRRSRAAANALAGLGVAPGDRVAWLGRNCAAWFDAFFGATRIRACLAPVNVRLAAAEIAFIVEDSGAAVMLVAADCAALADAALATLAAPPRIVTIGFDRPGCDRFEALCEAAGDAAPAAVPEGGDDIVQLYTSGTTGRPKGVRLTNANYACFLALSPEVEGFDYASDDSVLIVMPLFHVAGLNVSMAGLAHGCRVIVVPEFAPAEVLRLISAERVAHVFLVPSMIQMLLQEPGIADADFSSLKTVSYGASPISEAVLAAARSRMGCQFVQFYGMTESAGAGTALGPSMHTPDRLRSCGVAWPGLEATVHDPDGRELPPGEVGEIVIRGGTIMAGYWRRDEATAETVRDGGWLRTGDAGYRDAAGLLYVHDRVKDMIVTGGENVYPAEVENAIFGCPGVADVAVVGVPSDRWGEEVKAIVVAAGEAPDPAMVIAWARARIAGYKAPKSVDFVDALPRNASGKVLRRDLRAPYWAGRDRAVG